MRAARINACGFEADSCNVGDANEQFGLMLIDGRDAIARKFQRPPMVERPKLKFFDLWITGLRILTIAFITTGLSLGAKQLYFSVEASRVVGINIDADIKLALLGFLNKSLDVMLVSSLEYTAAMMLTVWMAKQALGRNARGVDFIDFGLKDELTKPWMTLLSFSTRWRRYGWSIKSLGRCLLCLTISISVMLQGVAVNTIMVPKERWWPNYNHTWELTDQVRESMTIQHPKIHLAAVDWLNMLGVGQSNVGRENHFPWDWALGLSASLSFIGLTNVVSTVRRPEKGWQHVYEWRLQGHSKRWVAVHTAFDLPRRPAETISADEAQVMNVFKWLRNRGHKPSKWSTGLTGNLNLIVPALNTQCTASNQSAQQQPFEVKIPAENASSVASFDIHLASTPSMAFGGAACSITFRQATFPVNFWIVDMATPDLSFNSYGRDWNKSITYEPYMPADQVIVRALAIQARDSLPRIETLVQTSGLLSYMLLMSRELQKSNGTITSDAAGLSVIVGVLLQNLLGTSNIYETWPSDRLDLRPSETVASFPMQWQIYGSGPRLSWEWVTVVILFIVLASLGFGIFQTLRHRMGSGPWVDLGGMMIVAQQTRPPLDDMDKLEVAQQRLYSVDKPNRAELQLRSRART